MCARNELAAAPTVTTASASGSRLTRGTWASARTEATAPNTTTAARGSGRGGSFIHTSALRLCATRRQTSIEAMVVSRRPVSLFLRLVPYSTLNTPVYHHVRSANNDTPAANVPAYTIADRTRTRPTAINASRRCAAP